MKLATAAQMRAMDRLAIEHYGIPGIVLMENAGRGVADLIGEHYPEECELGILVLCGPGNNGGDGFVIARQLFNRGYEVECFLLGLKNKLTGDARANCRVAERIGVPIGELRKEKELARAAEALSEAGVVVDALFGTGLTRAIEGPGADLIDLVNELEAPVVAVDVPSGLNADTGYPTGPAVIADLTCTLAVPKIGLFVNPGVEYCGEVEIVDISLPYFLQQIVELPVHLITEIDVAQHFGPRDPESHKGDFGHALIVGGSRGMSGAVVMAAEAASTAGAGLVTAAVPGSILLPVETALLEALKAGLADDGHGRFSAEALDAVLALAEKKSVVALGPGLGRSDSLETLVAGLATALKIPLVIDADGLNNLAPNLKLLEAEHGPLVLTPHPGEMSHLLGVPTEQVQADRLGSAIALAKKIKAIVVLKGARTVVAAPDGQAWINPTGNPGMASGGMGDVLTGLIAGLIAQEMDPLTAAICGVYLHGLAGDRAADNVGERALTAGAVLRELPATIKSMEDQLDELETESAD
ncbi:MAG: NAD(P)H-hydrate dehydratase [Myxococcales bacterium]|nr:NAD(P)H-hydrate dehydratase [Myxococcales bacterium]